MITWAQVERGFDYDGGLRDIYVRAATLADWKAVCGVLKKRLNFEFSIDGDPASFPEDVALVFAMRSTNTPMACVKLGTVRAVFHFFSEEEIECDIDPREVKSQVELDAVLEFLQEIGDAVGKPVLLTPENFQEYEILRYDPSSKTFKYTEAKESNQIITAQRASRVAD